MANFGWMIIAALALASVCESSGHLGRDDWTLFKQKHNKSYESLEVDTLRKAIFTRNKALVEKFNGEESGRLGYSVGLNYLSDYTDHELGILNGFKIPHQDKHKLQNSPTAQRFLDAILSDNSTEVPDEVDWRNVPGRVSPIKNQGLCGSCWAFSVTGVLEGQEAVRNASLVVDGKVTTLSEQNLVDCDRKGADGCNGGWMKDALEFVQREGGIDPAEKYIYEAKDGKCRFNKDEVVFTDAGASVLPEGDEQKLKEVVAKFGPVAVAIDAEWNFAMYREGVLNTDDCDNDLEDLDHAVLVVGYGTDEKHGDYWIVKNSWGVTWGDDGYIKMSRNKNNQCGIANVATIPTF